jgi:hypothetical protein
VPPITKLRVLTDAFDGAQLFELLQPIISNPAGLVIGIEPKLARQEALAVVRDALTAGEIYLSDVTAPDQPLPTSEALEAVVQDTTWEPLPPERILLLNLTPVGEKALTDLRR